MLGVTLRSDQPLPRLSQLRDAAATWRSDESSRWVEIRFRPAPESVRGGGDETWTLLAPRDEPADRADRADEPIVQLWRRGGDGPYRYRYRDGAVFWVHADGGWVWVDRPEDMSIEDLCSYLLGPVIALVLRLCGIVCLHASGVRIGDGAVAFAGAAHAGKSTLAAAFALAGSEAISDDLVSLIPQDGRFVVSCDAPYLNLWPRSAELLLGDTEALPRWSETWEKRYLHLVETPRRTPRALCAIYELALAPQGTATRIVALRGHEALMTLMRHARAAALIGDERRPAELATLSAVVRTVPIRRLQRARNASPQSVRDRVVADLETLGPAP